MRCINLDTSLTRRVFINLVDFTEGFCVKINTPSEFSHIDRRSKHKKIAIEKYSLSQDQNPTINTDAILQREKEKNKRVDDRKIKINLKTQQYTTQRMNTSSSLNKMVSIGLLCTANFSALKC
ncbi:hypothetical protein NEAUS04_2645 [Nematocida ausubeli]|uniref:Uncharacterized protein n=1 Tax=Nematocida ausubeli (strain ATCC PRA-371 / ERTm2) TaxID=1913371 RepID=A0A086J4K8_NEMA1|nr:uncharacterized protein NESG_00150 [Nematocida ausubeli]KAI5138822.1 hypothetical protein NEAUS06_2549 [Nematocida ausubeli]KAI5167069.1 hypothetical protein NEAUS04_2645 [Nematocida ausubeli]KFG27076.1 hypothetical protein NESG_00150 [Nematocida ausubeli]